MAFAKFPKSPPTFDFSALLKGINEARAKVNLPAITSGGPLWKRYVGSEGPEYDTAEEGGLRAVLKANAYALNDLKADHDTLEEREKTDVAALSSRVAALEAQQLDPFPGSG